MKDKFTLNIKIAYLDSRAIIVCLNEDGSFCSGRLLEVLTPNCEEELKHQINLKTEEILKEYFRLS